MQWFIADARLLDEIDSFMLHPLSPSLHSNRFVCYAKNVLLVLSSDLIRKGG